MSKGILYMTMDTYIHAYIHAYVCRQSTWKFNSHWNDATKSSFVKSTWTPTGAQLIVQQKQLQQSTINNNNNKQFKSRNNNLNLNISKKYICMYSLRLFNSFFDYDWACSFKQQSCWEALCWCQRPTVINVWSINELTVRQQTAATISASWSRPTIPRKTKKATTD